MAAWTLQSTAAFLACLCRGRSSRPHVCLVVVWLLLLTVPPEAGHASVRLWQATAMTGHCKSYSRGEAKGHEACRPVSE